MPNDSLPATPQFFLDWVRGQDTSSSADRNQQIREHIFALIAEIVKGRYASTEALDLPQGDTTLAQLFSSADRFGVPGAGYVAQFIDARSTPPASPHPSVGFQLGFASGMFSLASEHGKWMVRFPYFFMIGTMARHHMTNGQENDVVVLSTLTAANNAPVGGASQATILIVSAQTADLPLYAAYWLQRWQMSPTDTTANPVPQATRSYRRYDAATHLWQEAVVLKIPSGSLIIAYIGLDGTYQANRAHFLDLLTSLRVRGSQ